MRATKSHTLSWHNTRLQHFVKLIQKKRRNKITRPLGLSVIDKLIFFKVFRGHQHVALHVLQIMNRRVVTQLDPKIQYFDLGHDIVQPMAYSLASNLLYHANSVQRSKVLRLILTASCCDLQSIFEFSLLVIRCFLALLQLWDELEVLAGFHFI